MLDERGVDAVLVGRVGDEHLGLRVVDAVADAVVAVEHRHRQQDRARLVGAEERGGGLGRRRQQHRDAVALLDAVRAQHVGEAVGELLQLAPLAPRGRCPRRPRGSSPACRRRACRRRRRRCCSGQGPSTRGRRRPLRSCCTGWRSTWVRYTPCRPPDAALLGAYCASAAARVRAAFLAAALRWLALRLRVAAAFLAAALRLRRAAAGAILELVDERAQLGSRPASRPCGAGSCRPCRTPWRGCSPRSCAARARAACRTGRDPSLAICSPLRR